MCIIKYDNVSLGYDGKDIIENISFCVNPGDYVCIVGENGSGKSTLTKGLLGLIKPYKGRIELNCSRIGYLPQQTLLQRDFPASVYEIVLSGCLNRHMLIPFYTKKDKAAANKAIKKMEIESLKKRSYQELSGGQQQRVLLARALCAAGGLIVLDEPAAGLDPIITNELYSLIFELNQKDSLTVMMVSHDIEAACRYATHILHIKNNSYYFGTVSDYKKTDIGKYFIGGSQK